MNIVKKKVCIFYQTYNKFPGGLYPYNKRIIQKYKGNLYKDYDLELISLPHRKGIKGKLINYLELMKLIFNTKIKKCDKLIIGYNDILFPVSILQKIIKPKFIELYPLYSKWYTFVKDYKRYKTDSWYAKLLLKSDKSDFKLSNTIFSDTKTHINLYKKYILDENKYDVFYVHTDYELFNPKYISSNKLVDKNLVFFHGGFIPLQGTPIIYQAISGKKNFYTLIFGNGYDYKKAISNYKQGDPEKTELLHFDYVDYEVLPNHIYSSEVCLGGPFGNSEKAKSVITNKTFEYLAMNKKVIVGDTPANKELLTIFPHKKHLIYFCPINNPQALRKKIDEALK